MAITRGPLGFEGHFTQVPNTWARDERLSRKARGLLVELMSHRVGWSVSVASLMAAGPEGRDAIQGMIRELESCGYLERRQSHVEGGKFGETDFTLVDPGDAKSAGQTVDGKPVDGLTVDGESAPIRTPMIKNTNSKKSTTAVVALFDEKFEEFWGAYPRKDGKAAARKAWPKAVKVRRGQLRAEGLDANDAHAADALVAAARLYAGSATLPDAPFRPHASTWLNGERWNDESVSARPGHKETAFDRNARTLREAIEREAREGGDSA